MSFRGARSLAGCLAVLVSARAAAQSAQPRSVQASLLATRLTISGTSAGGIGLELQYRFNRLAMTERGVVSLGAGLQRTRHEFPAAHFHITGLFVEPRFAFAISSNRFAPYAAARLALLRQSSSITDASMGGAIGGGAGFAYVLTKRLNLDAGFAFVIQSFADTHLTGTEHKYVFKAFAGYAMKAGFSLGL